MNGLMAVAMGAYAAHGLAGHEAALAERASSYQLLHAVALLGIDRLRASAIRLSGMAGVALTAGIVLFCGSLYVKAMAGPVLPGLLTPAGGISLMAGWLLVAAAGLMSRQ
ncbi:MAG: DUF423 domain-containing protein [Actinomycetota bacterium]